MRILLENGAVVEHQNENGHTPLMEAASCGHVGEFHFTLIILIHVDFTKYNDLNSTNQV